MLIHGLITITMTCVVLLLARFSTLGRIIENSPAERCGRLKVGDKILAVNDVDISRMLHEDIVNLIKDSGYSVKLAVAPPAPSPNDKRPNVSILVYVYYIVY